MQGYTEINAKTIDKWVDDGWEWGRAITREEYARAKDGCWSVLLTPLKPVPLRWFSPFLQNGRLDGVRLLGLASGGGQQMPIFAALGACGTLLDLSERQLASDADVARREGYAIDIVRADMTKPFPFGDGAFDIIFHPVSNCYVEDVHHIWRECFRVLRPGGVLLCGLDNGLNFMVDDFETRPWIISNKLPFNSLTAEPERRQAMIDNFEGLQFSHTLEDQIGGQLQAGFALTDVYEDCETLTLEAGIMPYWASRAVKPADAPTPAGAVRHCRADCARGRRRGMARGICRRLRSRTLRKVGVSQKG